MTQRRGIPTCRARHHFAAAAVAVATLTGAASAAVGGSGAHVLGAGTYVLIVFAVLFFPAAVIAPVIAGQLLAANIVLRGDGHPLLLLPVVAGVIATAELISVVARLGTMPERDAAPDLRRAGVAVLIGGSVFGVVVLAGRLPGPTGIVAITFAAAACLVLALLLARGMPAAARVGDGRRHVFPRFRGDGFGIEADWSNKPSRSELDRTAGLIRRAYERLFIDR